MRSKWSSSSPASRPGRALDAQVGERVRVEPRAVPGVEPVREDVGGLAGTDHRCHGHEALVDDPGAPAGSGRRWAPRSPTASSRTQARAPSSNAGSVRQPARPAGPRARPCQRQISSQPDCTAVLMSAPRCGHAPGPACSDPFGERQSTSSTPATVVPNGVPVRMSRLAPTTYQLPDGRAVARASAASMMPTFASRQVGSMAAHSRSGQASQRVRRRSPFRLLQHEPDARPGAATMQ